MVQIYLYVEGQTEQEFARTVLTPHLAGFGVYLMGANSPNSAVAKAGSTGAA